MGKEKFIRDDLAGRLDEFEKFIQHVGGIASAAKIVDMTESMVRHMQTGRRPIHPNTAARIQVMTRGALSARRLVFGDAYKEIFKDD